MRVCPAWERENPRAGPPFCLLGLTGTALSPGASLLASLSCRCLGTFLGTCVGTGHPSQGLGSFGKAFGAGGAGERALVKGLGLCWGEGELKHGGPRGPSKPHSQAGQPLRGLAPDPIKQKCLPSSLLWGLMSSLGGSCLESPVHVVDRVFFPCVWVDPACLPGVIFMCSFVLPLLCPEELQKCFYSPPLL